MFDQHTAIYTVIVFCLLSAIVAVALTFLWLRHQYNQIIDELEDENQRLAKLYDRALDRATRLLLERSPSPQQVLYDQDADR